MGRALMVEDAMIEIWGEDEPELLREMSRQGKITSQKEVNTLAELA